MSDEKRNMLYKELPLDVPYAISFSTTNVCNFKCFYCIQSKKDLLPERVKRAGMHMEYPVFKKIVDNIKEMVRGGKGGKITFKRNRRAINESGYR